MSDLDRDALDSWIESPMYDEETVTVYCHNPACKTYGDQQTALSFREYGTWYWKPDECPHCYGEWSEQPPEEEDDE